MSQMLTISLMLVPCFIFNLIAHCLSYLHLNSLDKSQLKVCNRKEATWEQKHGIPIWISSSTSEDAIRLLRAVVTEINTEVGFRVLAISELMTAERWAHVNRAIANNERTYGIVLTVHELPTDLKIDSCTIHADHKGNIINCELIISPQMLLQSKELTRLQLKHELGHAIGLKDSKDYASIMHCAFRISNCFTKHEIKLIRKKYLKAESC